MTDPTFRTGPELLSSDESHQDKMLEHLAVVTLTIERRGYRTVWIKAPLDLDGVDFHVNLLSDAVGTMARRAWDTQARDGRVSREPRRPVSQWLRDHGGGAPAGGGRFA